MDIRIGVGIVGCGAFSVVHAEAISRRKDAYVAGTTSRTYADAKALADRVGATPYPSLDEMLAQRSVDAVVVCLPHAAHEEASVKALAAGKHVLVEKPLAHSLEACDRIVEAVEASDGVLVTGHMMQFAPAYHAAREMIVGDAIGEIVHIESRQVIPWEIARRRAWHRSIADGGGMWLVQGVHIVDRVSWLGGCAATAAIGTSRRVFHAADDQDADDLGIATLFFRGFDASITLLGITRGITEVHTDVHGSKGRLRVSHRGELKISTHDGWEGDWKCVTEPSADWREQASDAQWDSFVSAVRGETPPEPSAAHGRYVVSAIDAIRRSQDSRQVEELR